MKKVELINKLKDIIFIVEMILAVMILFGVLAGLISTILQIPLILAFTRDQFYTSFKDFLGNALLLVVGVELIRMLITHTTRATLELIVFVIARKLLIYTDSMMDIFLGTIALAIAFATIKYLLPGNSGPGRGKPTFSGAMRVRDLENRLGIEIPVDGDPTLADFIRSLRHSSKPFYAGEKIDAGPVNLIITGVTETGEIREVEVSDSNFIYTK